MPLNDYPASWSPEYPYFANQVHFGAPDFARLGMDAGEALGEACVDPRLMSALDVDPQPPNDLHTCANADNGGGTWCEAEVDKESAHLSDQKIRDSCLDHLRLAKNVSDAAGPTGRPFFVACGLHKPHVPWVVPQEFFGFFPPVEEIPLAAYVYAPIGMPDAAWHPPADVKDMVETPSFNGTVNGADQNLAPIPRSWPSFDVPPLFGHPR